MPTATSRKNVTARTKQTTPRKAKAPTSLNPQRILEVGIGFWGSKVLLTAVELEVFTVLGSGALTGEELGKKLKFHPRGWVG